jgi:hypothetical protein
MILKHACNITILDYINSFQNVCVTYKILLTILITIVFTKENF